MTRITDRAEGRREADAIVSLVKLPTLNHREAFIDQLRDKLLPVEVAAEKAADERTLRELLKWEMTFGQHFGKHLDEIPRSDLEWLVEKQEETMKLIARYLKLTEEDEE